MRDRFIIRLITAFSFLCIFSSNASGLYVDSLTGFDSVIMNEDLIVTDNGIFNATRTDINSSIFISNHGVINSNFYVKEIVNVYVKNAGVINGDFYLARDATLVQVIESADDITDIDFASNFSVLVHNADNLSLTDVLGISHDADKIILDNSTLVLYNNKRTRINISARPIEIVGDVVLKLNSIYEINYSVPVLRNVSGEGNVIFDVADMEPLYNVLGVLNNGDLYMNLVRETDYARVLKNDKGNFLNVLRRNNPNDRLFVALDSATDMDSLNRVMANSVRLHPEKLMAPVSRMNMFDMLSSWRYGDMTGIYTVADFMMSSSDYGSRANVAVVGNIANNIYAAMGVYLGAIDVSDDINDYTAYLYGANISTHFDDGMTIGNLSFGANHVKFDVGSVLDDRNIVNNPNGISGYMAADMGMYVVRNNSLTIAPFVGVVTNYISVLDNSEFSAFANFATEINWAEHEFDILYDYGLRGSVLTNGVWYANAYLKFAAPFDDIGAEFNVGALHDDNGLNYKISISAHILF